MSMPSIGQQPIDGIDMEAIADHAGQLHGIGPLAILIISHGVSDFVGHRASRLG